MKNGKGEKKGRVTDEELVKKAQSGDQTATEEILERYKHVVRARARRFFLAGGETEDLLQEGMVGLYQAINAYDAQKERRMSFKNFAYLCIARRMTDAVRKASRGQKDALYNYVSIFEPQLDLAEDRNAEEEVIRIEDGGELLQR
ncbi:MAG: sigma-70 family RNA polymerase sigma factor, partial [Clostridia bacterium]|nr:sigma-70 family RNA polymerase sigma factor [Clostridia bacterium]